MKAKEQAMYMHAKLGHIGELKKKIHGYMARSDAEGEMDEAPHPEKSAREIGQELHDTPKGPPPAEGSPEEEAGETPEEEAGEGPIDDLEKMKKDYFRPAPKAKRPGTAMMIAPPSKSHGKDPGMIGKPGRHNLFGRGK